MAPMALTSLAWASAFFILILGLITVNLAHGAGELLLYSPKIAIVDLGLSFFLASLFVLYLGLRRVSENVT